MKQAFTQEIKNVVQDIIRDIHVAVPGKIVSFDSEKCEATILPTAKFRKPSGESIDFPKIFEVPVWFPQAASQGVSFVWLVEPGDECIVIFLEQSLDQWRTGAETDTELKFDLQNAIAITGLFSTPNPHVSRACDNASIIIQREETFMELFDAKIEVYTDGDIYEEADVNINIDAGVDINITAKANITITAKANTTINTTGETNITSGGNCNIIAARINLN